jgi:hypothetical protein
MSYTNFFKCIKPVDIGDGISYRIHKHWAMNYLAGEGETIYKGDRSGCLGDDGKCYPPKVVIQRIYEKGGKHISAVLSYPQGINCSDQYQWEIYLVDDGDIQRFDDDSEMEDVIRRILK